MANVECMGSESEKGDMEVQSLSPVNRSEERRVGKECPV